LLVGNGWPIQGRCIPCLARLHFCTLHHVGQNCLAKSRTAKPRLGPSRFTRDNCVTPTSLSLSLSLSLPLHRVAASPFRCSKTLPASRATLGGGRGGRLTDYKLQTADARVQGGKGATRQSSVRRSSVPSQCSRLLPDHPSPVNVVFRARTCVASFRAGRLHHRLPFADNTHFHRTLHVTAALNKR
jgi:hypothetical protein